MEYTIKVPDDLTVVVDEQKKVISVLPKFISIKAGDIIAIQSYSDSQAGKIMISIVEDYNGYGNHAVDSLAFIDYSGTLHMNDHHGLHNDNTVRYATETERELLFDNLKSHGIVWNAENNSLRHIDQIYPNIAEILQWQDDSEHLFFRADANVVYGYNQHLHSIISPVSAKGLVPVTCRVQKVDWDELQEGDLFFYNSFDDFKDWLELPSDADDEYDVVDWLSFKISHNGYVNFSEGKIHDIQTDRDWSYFKVIPLPKL